MITPDQIKKAAEDHAEGYMVYGTKLYTRSRNAFIAGAAWMQEQDQWISVSERLPEIGQEIIVRCEKVELHHDIICFNGLFPTKHITHWCAIPNPPKTKP